LRNAHGFYYRRPALALGKPRGLFLIGVHAAEFLSVGIINGHQKVVMAPPLVFVKRRFAPFGSLGCFRHFRTLRLKNVPELSQGKGPKRKPQIRRFLCRIQGYRWTTLSSKIRSFEQKSMKHFKDSNVFIYVRRFAGRRKQTMIMNYSKQPPILEDLRNHSPEEIAELRVLLSVNADMRPDPRRPGFFEVTGIDRVYYIFKYPNGSKVLLLGVWDRDPVAEAVACSRTAA